MRPGAASPTNRRSRAADQRHVGDYARFGQFVLGVGRVDGRESCRPDGFRRRGSQRLKGGKRLDYGYTGGLPRPPRDADPEGAFYADGIFGQFIYLNPKEQVVVAEWSARSKPEGMDIVDDLDFFRRVTAALR